jgi:hypothetical protein
MKRPLIYNNTRSKRPKLVCPLYVENTHNNNYVSASDVYNFMVGDSLVDWLKLSSYSRNTLNNHNHNRELTFKDYILDKGKQFEIKLVNYINDNIENIVKVSDYITDISCNKTIELIKDGVPIIYSAPIRNNYNNTKGIIDLLVRSDYINKLTTIPCLSTEETQIKGSKLSGLYHYVVVDIKFSTLQLTSDGKHLQNSDHLPAYKSQLLIYTQGIGRIQGYTAPYAFIIGRRTKYTKNSICTNDYNCLERMGKIDYANLDKKYIKETQKAINWVNNVRKNGNNWIVNPPSNIELYPNMCKDSGYWNSEKYKIAEEIKEITTIWNVGKKHRDIAIDKGIYSWTDVRCTANNLGIKGNNAIIIDKILNINRQNTYKLLPLKIKTNKYHWKNINRNEVFVDFETISDVISNFEELPKQNSSDMIFMIGVGWYENNKWNYNSYTCNQATYDEEYRIMDEFARFIKDKHKPYLNYWCAENKFWENAECRQFDIATNNRERKSNILDNWKLTKWSDLYSIFKEEPIVIKDCFNFGLKSIAKAMKKHNMINIEIESNCNSGMTAMVKAIQFYKGESSYDIMKDISKYNEFDCKVLWEILLYLRKNHV